MHLEEEKLNTTIHKICVLIFRIQNTVFSQGIF